MITKQEEIDWIWQKADSLLRDGKFNECNELLSATPEDMPLHWAVSLITSTYTARDKLSNWKIFFDKAEKHFIVKLGSERTENILKDFKNKRC